MQLDNYIFTIIDTFHRSGATKLGRHDTPYEEITSNGMSDMLRLEQVVWYGLLATILRCNNDTPVQPQKQAMGTALGEPQGGKGPVMPITNGSL